MAMVSLKCFGQHCKFFIMPLDTVNNVVFSTPCGMLGWLPVERMRHVNNETPTDILYAYF